MFVLWVLLGLVIVVMIMIMGVCFVLCILFEKLVELENEDVVVLEGFDGVLIDMSVVFSGVEVIVVESLI